MNSLSPFRINNQAIYLKRESQTKPNSPLQAWDATDEYIISHLSEIGALQSTKHICILNDDFGALAIALSQHKITSVSDSLVSHQAVKANLALNELSEVAITFQSSTEALPESADIFILKLPKSSAYLQFQLANISQVCKPNTLVIAGAKAKDIHTSTLSLFEQTLGSCTTSLAMKKSRLIFCTPEKVSQPKADKVWTTEQPKLTICNQANVFSRDKLDIGARFFMQHLPKIKAQQQVIDLACGNGVIGLTVLAQQPQAQLTFIDESNMAVQSAKQNVQHNFPELIEQCQFIQQDALTNHEEKSADFILCNPPFHQQHAVTDHIAWKMFNQSKKVLKTGGELRIIGNRQLGYHVKLKRIFGNCQHIASNAKFVILSAVKS